MNIEHLDGGSIRRTDDPGEPTTHGLAYLTV